MKNMIYQFRTLFTALFMVFTSMMVYAQTVAGNIHIDCGYLGILNLARK